MVAPRAPVHERPFAVYDVDARENYPANYVAKPAAREVSNPKVRCVHVRLALLPLHFETTLQCTLQQYVTTLQIVLMSIDSSRTTPLTERD